MTIVCDTNILISALIFPGGFPDKIFRLILAGRYQHATSPDLLNELKRVLERKFKLPPLRVQEAMDLVSQTSQLIYPIERETIIVSDESDNRVIECAVHAAASILITGDRHDILPLKEYKGIRILSPRDFCMDQGIL